MDGTLTVAMHDFEGIRQTLGLPVGLPILESISALPPEQAELTRQRLNVLELDLARQAQPQPSAHELLRWLQKHGAQLAILTRNSRQNAIETLHACGLLAFFDETFILGRESAPPKPSPAGIHQLIEQWHTSAITTVMVGDYLFDLQAGRQAGTATVYLDVNGDDLWTDQVDVRVQSLRELLHLI